ncbi:MAG: 50S ribosomal protein L23 [Candidatus Pacebacteria bacterium]|nr:50S ribosomal protein L23 [Candidatus Paceibacterota bacterium]
MALFTPKEDTAKSAKPSVKTADAAEKKPRAKVKKVVHKISKSAGANLTKTPGRILKCPRITEKAVYMTLQHAYVFEVAADATKRDVVTAVHALYNVQPVKVNMVVKQPRAYVARFRNRRGTKAGMKKAYVFLKKGEKIDIA